MFQRDIISKSDWQVQLYRDVTFHHFSKLPIELREKIWWYTWPGPRLIEVGRYGRDATCFFPDDNEDDRPFFLRIAGPFSIIQSIHTKQEEIPQQWFSPVALFVCQESRRHTLRHYRLIQHAVFDPSSFYSDPSVDVLWFNYEFTGHNVNQHAQSQEHMDKLSRWYGTQLDLFKNVLIEEMFWDPERGNQEYLRSLPSLETILIMDTSRQDMNTQVELYSKDLQHCIAVGKREYSNFKARHLDWHLKSIEYLDRNSNFTEFMWGASLSYRDDSPLHSFER